MNDFLWSQAASPEEPNYFIIDGKMSRYSGSASQNEAMEFMSSFDQQFEVSHCEGDNTSLSFYVKSNTEKNLWQLSGNFKEKDEAGRSLVYVYTTRQSEYENMIDNLKRYSKMLNLSLYETDVDMFMSFFIKNNRKKDLIPILIFLGAVIGLIIAFCGK